MDLEVRDKVVALLVQYEININKYNKLESEIHTLGNQLARLRDYRDEISDELNTLRVEERVLYADLKLDPNFDEDLFKEEISELFKNIKEDGRKIDTRYANERIQQSEE